MEEKTFKKNDQDKPDISLVTPDIILGIARAMTFGKNKYGKDNWRLCTEPHRVYAALQRHLLAFWDGEGIDDESKLSHLDHAGACLMMLQWVMYRKPNTDNSEDS